MEKEKTMQSNIEGVKYRRAKNWQIALIMMQAMGIGCFSAAIGYVSYAANLGFGISTVAVGTIMTLARIFDGVTDPLISMLIDKTNTRFGKIRIFMTVGWVIEALSLKLLFDWVDGKSRSLIVFVLIYLFYYIGYTFHNMSSQLVNPILTNDPKQRPMVGVWHVMYSYIVNIGFSMIVMVVLLPRFGNTYSLEFLGIVSTVTVAASAVFTLISFIGLAQIDKPENFIASSDKERSVINFKDMWNLIKDNKALQRYIVAQTSDKLAIQINGQTIVNTILYGIIIGSMGLSAILNMVGVIPGLIFGIVGGKYAGRHGSRDAISFWCRISIVLNMIFIVFMFINANRVVMRSVPMLIIFCVLTMISNGLRTAISIAATSMMSDVVDYEAYRSGKYMPGIVAGIYSFIDKLVSSFGALIATVCVAAIGYTEVMPQPTDEKTMAVVLMGTFVFYGIPILGWICSIFAMKNCPITKEKMVEIQKEIADRKKAD